MEYKDLFRIAFAVGGLTAIQTNDYRAATVNAQLTVQTIGSDNTSKYTRFVDEEPLVGFLAQLDGKLQRPVQHVYGILKSYAECGLDSVASHDVLAATQNEDVVIFDMQQSCTLLLSSEAIRGDVVEQCRCHLAKLSAIKHILKFNAVLDDFPVTNTRGDYVTVEWNGFPIYVDISNIAAIASAMQTGSGVLLDIYSKLTPLDKKSAAALMYKLSAPDNVEDGLLDLESCRLVGRKHNGKYQAILYTYRTYLGYAMSDADITEWLGNSQTARTERNVGIVLSKYISDHMGSGIGSEIIRLAGLAGYKDFSDKIGDVLADIGYGG